MRAGTEVILPNLSFQLLVALIRGAPNVLSYDALMSRVWPGLVVSPETVTKRANLPHEALGDDAREPRYTVAERETPTPEAPAAATATSEAQDIAPKPGADFFAVC